MARIRNVFEIIELYGHDENFEPQMTPDFVPTAAPAGSRQKIDVLAERIQRGLPLWHPQDSIDAALNGGDVEEGSELMATAGAR